MSTTITSELELNENVFLSGSYIAQLPAGLTDYTGILSGSGSITISDAGTLATTLDIAGDTIILASAEAQTLNVVSGTLVSVDVTAAMKANQPIDLSAVPITIELPNGAFSGFGTISYTGTLGGVGTLIVSGEDGNTLFLPGNYVLQLGGGFPSPLQTVSVSYANGVYTTNWNASVAAGELITVNRYLSTLNLASGVTKDNAGISGTGTLAVSSGPSGGALFEDGGLDLLIGGANQTWEVSFGTAISVLLTTPLLNDWDIDLAYDGSATLAHTGVTNYTGRIDGTGAITVSAAAGGGGTLVIAGSVTGSETPPLTLDLVNAGETEVITLNDGAWSVDYSAAMAADDAIVLYATSTATLVAGTTTLTRGFTGTGSLTISGDGTAASTLAIGADKFIVAAGANETLSVTNGTVTNVDVTTAMQANNPIYLSNVPLTVSLPLGQFVGPGTIDFTGLITGSGELIVTAQDSGEIYLPGGLQEELGSGYPAPLQTVTITDTGGVYATDWTKSVYAAEALDFDGDSTITLSAGTVIDTALIRGAGLVTLSTGAGGAGTWVSEDGTLALGAANETEIVTFANNGWSIDLGSLVTGGDVIALGNITQLLALAKGVTTDAGTITGNGTITVTAAGPGTLVADGHDFVFTAAGETQLISLSGGVFNQDITAALLANDNVVLSGNATASLPAGTTNYTGSITGAGTLTLTASSAGPSTLVIDGQNFILTAANEVLPVSLAAGVLVENISAAVSSGDAVSLTGAASLSLGAGKTGSNISGAGSISVTSGTAGSTLFVGGTQVLALPDANETATLSLSGGVWSENVSAALSGNQDIALLATVTASAIIGAGTTVYTGTISGSGTLIISASGYPARVVIPGAGSVVLSATAPAETLSVNDGVISLNAGTAIAAGKNVTLGGGATAQLASGTITDSGTITGAGALTVTAGTAGSVFIFDGDTISLPSGGEEVILTLANGALGENIGPAALADAAIALGGVPAFLSLSGGNISDSSLSGTGSLVVETGNDGASFFFNGGSVVLGNGFETVTAHFVNGVETDLDISQALVANQFVDLTGPGSATLAPGDTTYSNGGIAGTNGVALTLTASASGGSTLIVGTATLALAAAGETEIYTYESGLWSANASTAFAAGQNIDLSVPTAVTLSAGTTTYKGTFSGPDFLTLVGNAGASSTALFNGQSFTLAAGATEILALEGGTFVPELNAAVAAEQNVTLSGTDALLLGVGGTNYRGTLSGSGEIIVTGAAGGAGVLQIGGQTLDLAAGETDTLIVGNGTVTSVDITQAVLANQAIALSNLAAQLEIPAGRTVYTGRLTGTGSIKLGAGASGGTIVIGGVTYALAANASETVTIAGVNVSGAIAADQAITLTNVPDFATLAAGLVNDTGSITGNGTLVVTASNGPTTLKLDGETFALPNLGDVLTLSLAGGVWEQNVDGEIDSNQNILLNNNAATDVDLSGSNLDYTGTLLGSGELVLTNRSSSDSFFYGTLDQELVSGVGQSLTFDVSNGVVTAVDISAVLAANDPIKLNERGIATLAAGTTDYTQGNGNLVLSDVTLALTASASAASTLVVNGQTLAIATPGQTEDFVFTASGWELDATVNFAANQNILLDAPTVITLAAGITTYTGTLSGAAPLTLTSTAAASTAIINGQTFALASPNETELLTLVNGTWVQNVSAAIAADKTVVLNGNDIVASLASGLTNDTGSISGTGSIILVSSNTASSTLAVDGQVFTFGQANETETLSLSGGVWHVDVTQAITDQQVVVLNGAETAHLTSGVVTDGASITGNGSLILEAGPTTNTGLRLDHSTVILPDAGEIVTLSQIGSTGVWQENIDAAVAANEDIQLNSSTPAVLTLSAAITDYTGTISNAGIGTLEVTAAQSGATLVIEGQILSLPANGESENLLDNNGNLSVDLTAALAANHAIAFTGLHAQATLTGGTETYTGTVAGNGSLTVIATTASALLLGGETFALAAGQSETLIDAGGVWTGNITSLLQAGDAVALATHNTLTLSGGVLNATGSVTGNGTITITAGNKGGTLVLDGQTIALPGVAETELLILGADVLTEDITPAVAADEAVQLTGTNAVLSLSGFVNDTASITGAGVLTLTSGPSGGGTVVIAGGQEFALGGANESVTATLTNGVWTTNLSNLVTAGDPVIVAGNAVATLSAGTTRIAALTGNGALSLIAASNTASTMSVTGGGFVDVAAGQSVTLTVAGSHVNANITSEIAAKDAIVLGSDASAFLAAGNLIDTGGVTGNGELTLFGATTGASTITLDGTSYTIAEDGVLGLSFTNGTAAVNGEASTGNIDITAAIDADQQSIVLNGGKYIIYVPAGETVTYGGVMSGTGSLEVAGGGKLVLTGESTFTLPADQLQESVTTASPQEFFYDGDDLGLDNQGINILQGTNAPALIIDAGTEVDYSGTGAIYSAISAFGASFNIDNVLVNGTFGVDVTGGYGFGFAIGELSGDGLVATDDGSQFVAGDNSFSGKFIANATNLGGGHENFTLPNVAVIDDGFVLAISTQTRSTETSGTLTVATTIYEQHFGNSVHNQGAGLLILTGQYLYSDSGSEISPALSNPLLNYMLVGGNASQRNFDTGLVQQFGDGTNAVWFMPGNAVTTSLYFGDSDNTVGLDYNGVVRIDTSFGPAQGTDPGAIYTGNLIVVGTPGDHIIYTEQMQINGFTQIDANAILQLGDGTKGNSQTITTTSAAGPITGVYSTSGGNGALLTAESNGGAATDRIIDNGQLIIDNVNGAIDGVGPISLSNISGAGSLFQEGTQLVTLLENTDYTGGTTIANGTLAIVQSSAANDAAGISASSLVTLLNVGATLDISQAGQQTIQNLVGVAGAVVALGGNTLTLGTANSTEFDGTIADGGLAGGTGGGIVKQGSGTLTLGGDSSYTGATTVKAGTLQLAGALLASTTITVAAGAVLSGTGDATGSLNDAGVIAAQGGTLSLGSVFGAGALQIGSNADLVLTGGATEIVTFEGGGDLSLSDPSAFQGTVAGFDQSDKISLTNLVATGVSFATTTDILSVFEGSVRVAQFAINPPTAGTVFTLSKQGNGSEITLENAPCFCPGTLILTAKGQMAIEDLLIGDLLMTESGVLKPIKWIGKRSYAGAFALANRNIWPIRISRHALADNVPSRDLYASPDHALYIDQRLVPLRLLVTGNTIAVADNFDIINYYNIELDAHDVIYAENVAVETYSDCGNRAMFHNADDFAMRYPGEKTPQWKFCAPVLEHGERLLAIQRRLFARAGNKTPAMDLEIEGFVDHASRNLISGWARFETHSAGAVLLDVFNHGALIGTALANEFRGDLADAGIGNGRHGFQLRLSHPLDPAIRHEIVVRGRTSQRALSGSPMVIEPTESIDPMMIDDLRRQLGALGSRTRSLEEAEALVELLSCETGRLKDVRAEYFRLKGPTKRRRGGMAAPARRALVIDHAWPDPAQDAGSQAIIAHMHSLRRLGWHVCFMAKTGAPIQPAGLALLRAEGITCYPPAECCSVEELLSRQAGYFELIYLHRISVAAAYIGLIRHYLPNARIIYSVADLHYLRLARQAQVEDRPELMQRANWLKRQELTTMWQADAVITHSNAEANLLRWEQIAPARIHVVPWAVRPGPAPRRDIRRRGVLFVANFLHAPNRDGLTWFVQSVLPILVEALPEITITVVGAGLAPASVRQLTTPRMTFLGHVENLQSLYQNALIAIAPLRFGAGLKGKVLEAWAYGLPCVMTPIAAEGLPLDEILETAIAETPATFAERIIGLHHDVDRWAALSKHGRKIIRSGFSQKSTDLALSEASKPKSLVKQTVKFRATR